MTIQVNSRLTPGARYEWVMVVHTLTVGQEHWGTYGAQPGETVADAMEVIRKSCARKMGAPEHVVKIEKFSFKETQ